MKATEAAILSEKKSISDFNSYLKGYMESGSDEEKATLLSEIVKAVLDENIRFVAQEGKRSLMLEPFATIPGKYHLPEMEDAIMLKIVDHLEEGGYQEVSWDRRDKRVVLRFKW